MSSLISMSEVGSTNSGLFSTVAPIYYSDYGTEHHTAVEDIIATIEDMSDAGHDTYRSDMMGDINKGLSLVVSGIRVISAILTVLGGSGNRRGDEYEEAVESLMSFGTAMLRVGGSNLLDYFSSPFSASAPVAVNKLGVAAYTGDTDLSQDEILHRIQVQKIVSSLSPEQILEQQQVVFSHIRQQQTKDNLTDVEATKLLIETLEHNGLPVPDSLRPSSDTKNTVENATPTEVTVDNSNMINKLSSLVSGATGMISSILTPSSSLPVETSGQVTSLPQQGTWEHKVMLTMFNAQQSVNMLIMDIFGQDTVDTNHIGGHFVKSDKVGQAAVTSIGQPSSDGGILASVVALPQSVSTAAYQLVKFVLPPSATEPDSETYSQVHAGVRPAHAAIGLLTTGAIGSVIYSYVATDSDLATSVTHLAKCAVDAVRRNGIVSAAADVFASVTANVDEDEKEENIGNINYNYYDDSIYGNGGYSDYGYGFPSPDYDKQDTYYQSQEEYENVQIPDDAPHHIPETVQFYELEHNPWMLLGSGQGTDHLYRSLSKRGAMYENNSETDDCEKSFLRCKIKIKRNVCLIIRTLCRRK